MLKKKDVIHRLADRIDVDKKGNDLVIHRGYTNKVYKSLKNDYSRYRSGKWFQGNHNEFYKATLEDLFVVYQTFKRINYNKY